MTRAVARLGRLDAVLAHETPEFDYWPVHVRYVVGGGQSSIRTDFARRTSNFPVRFIAPTLHNRTVILGKNMPLCHN